jgi:hypothetical protein
MKKKVVKKYRKAKPKTAWAVINKKKPVIDVLDIFSHNDVKCNKDEILIRVKIEQI